MNYQYSNPDQYGGYDQTKLNNIYTPNPECSSGCESGWTHYLDNDDDDSSVSPRNNESMTRTSSKNRFVKKEAYQEEDEDLSMVSDASSGPPHFLDQEDNSRLYHCTEDLLSRSRRTTKEKRRSKLKDHQSSLLDDTASSPLFDHSNKNFNVNRSQPTIREDVMIDYSQGYSTTQFEARTPYHEHYDFFQSENHLQQNQWF